MHDFTFLHLGQQLSGSYAQKVSEQRQNIDDLPFHRRFMLKYRRILAPIIPGVIVYCLWIGYMVSENKWYLFKEKYFMSLTMIIGSLLAGRWNLFIELYNVSII